MVLKRNMSRGNSLSEELEVQFGAFLPKDSPLWQLVMNQKLKKEDNTQGERVLQTRKEHGGVYSAQTKQQSNRIRQVKQGSEEGDSRN